MKDPFIDFDERVFSFQFAASVPKRARRWPGCGRAVRRRGHHAIPGRTDHPAANDLSRRVGPRHHLFL